MCIHHTRERETEIERDTEREGEGWQRRMEKGMKERKKKMLQVDS